jgi:hypothetical protein
MANFVSPTPAGEQTLDTPPVHPQTPYPPVVGRIGPNRGICTGSCRPGTCDSQGFCIDSACGSVIKSSSCKKGKDKDKDKKKKKHGKTTTTTTTSPEGTTTSTITEPPSTVTIPAGPTDLQPAPTQVQPTTPGQTTSTTTPTTTPTGTTSKPVGKRECRVGNLSSHGKRDTCRWNFDTTVGHNDYAIDCDVTLGQGPPQSTDSEWPKDEPRLEITSGGPGSTSHNCCGWTVAVNNKDGTLHLETEDWSPGKKMSTTGSVYLNRGTSISNSQPIFGKTVYIRWV